MHHLRGMMPYDLVTCSVCISFRCCVCVCTVFFRVVEFYVFKAHLGMEMAN